MAVGDVTNKCGITLVKRFTYRSNTIEEFSNQYWFTGAPPTSFAGWSTLADALIVQEKSVLHPGISIIRWYAHNDPDPKANNVASRNLLDEAASVVGTLNYAGSGSLAAGDAAAWIRWKTSRLTSPGGKPIYLRKYFHGVAASTAQSTTPGDTVHSAWRTAALALGAKLRDGTFAEARTLTDRNHTDVLVSHAASVYLTTRTLKRRSKRNPTS